MTWEEVMSHKETQIPLILSVTSIFTFISVVVVALRFYARIKIRGLWLDDWFILASLIMGSICSIVLIFQVPLGFGSHVYDLPQTPQSMHDAMVSLRWLLVAQFTYFTSIGLVKISILLFILKIDRRLNWWVYGMLAFVTALTIATDFGTIFQCTPIAFAWDQSIPGGYCMNRSAFWEAIAGLNIFADVIIYLLPINSLWNVQIPKRQRIGLCFIFAMGLFVVLTEVFRLTTLKAPGKSQDPTWDNVACGMWSIVEYTVAILCASLPALKPLFSGILGESIKSTTGGSSGNSSGYNSRQNTFGGGGGARKKFMRSELSTYNDLESGYHGAGLRRDTSPAEKSEEWQMQPTTSRGYEANVMGRDNWSPAESKESMVKQSGVITKTTNISVMRTESPN